MPKTKVKQAVLAASLTRVAEEKLSESYLHVIGIDEAGNKSSLLH
jgi:ribonuclease HIII